MCYLYHLHDRAKVLEHLNFPKGKSSTFKGCNGLSSFVKCLFFFNYKSNICDFLQYCAHNASEGVVTLSHHCFDTQV